METRAAGSYHIQILSFQILNQSQDLLFLGNFCHACQPDENAIEEAFALMS